MFRYILYREGSTLLWIYLWMRLNITADYMLINWLTSRHSSHLWAGRRLRSSCFLTTSTWAKFGCSLPGTLLIDVIIQILKAGTNYRIFILLQRSKLKGYKFLLNTHLAIVNPFEGPLKPIQKTRGPWALLVTCVTAVWFLQFIFMCIIITRLMKSFIIFWDCLIKYTFSIF